MLNGNTTTTERTLNDFEHFMRPGKDAGSWTLMDRRHDLLRYEKILPGTKPSCFLGAILLLLGLVPGILYLALARRETRTFRLTVAVAADGTLSPSGDKEGLAKFREFMDPRGFARQQLIGRIGALVLIVFVIVVLIAVFGRS